MMAIDPDSFARLLDTLGNKIPPPLVLDPPKGGDSTPAPVAMHQTAPMVPHAAPARITCAQCARWQPGTPPGGIGRCNATSNGLPPKGGNGYGAPYPNAPRSCPEYLGAH
jgi:hypothetical protein